MIDSALNQASGTKNGSNSPNGSSNGFNAPGNGSRSSGGHAEGHEKGHADGHEESFGGLRGMIVHGPAGVGKTALIKAILTHSPYAVVLFA